MPLTIAIVSDTHDQLDKLEIPVADVLIHCGDFCRRGLPSELPDFVKHFSALSHKYKLLVVGNHDYPFLSATHYAAARQLLDPRKITFLEDSAVEIQGVKFYGGKWRSRMLAPPAPVPKFRLPFLSRKTDGVDVNAWDAIPEDTDVLITHGPPHGILDVTPGGSHIGCEILRKRVDKLIPRVHCFGHVHHSYGTRQLDSTLFVNAASVDESYIPSHRPVLIRLSETGPAEVLQSASP